MPGTGVGVPDGHNIPSIVLEHRYVVTVLPDLAGRIEFAHLPSMLGSFAIRRGIITVRMAKINTATAESYLGTVELTFNSDTALMLTSLSPVTTVPFANNAAYYIVPFQEWYPPTGVNVLEQFGAGTFSVDAFRVIASVGKFAYTGTSLNNAGVASAARSDVRVMQPLTDTGVTLGTTTAVGSLQPWQSGLPELSGNPSPGGAYYEVSTQGPGGFANNAQLSGVVVNPVTDGAELINVPFDFDYQPLRVGILMPDDISTATDVPGQGPDRAPFSQLVNNNTTTFAAGPQPGIGHASTTFVSIAGMAQDQAITYSSRTCVEYQLRQSSNVHRFAKLGPPNDPSTIERVKSFARALPAASPPSAEGWFPHLLKAIGGQYLRAEKSSIEAAWRFGTNLVTSMLPGRGNQMQRIGNSMGGLSIMG